MKPTTFTTAALKALVGHHSAGLEVGFPGGARRPGSEDFLGGLRSRAVLKFVRESEVAFVFVGFPAGLLDRFNSSWKSAGARWYVLRNGPPGTKALVAAKGGEIETEVGEWFRGVGACLTTPKLATPVKKKPAKKPAKKTRSRQVKGSDSGKWDSFL